MHLSGAALALARARAPSRLGTSSNRSLHPVWNQVHPRDEQKFMRTFPAYQERTCHGRRPRRAHGRRLAQLLGQRGLRLLQLRADHWLLRLRRPGAPTERTNQVLDKRYSANAGAAWAREAEAAQLERSVRVRHCGRSALKAVYGRTQHLVAAQGSQSCAPCSFPQASTQSDPTLAGAQGER